MKIYSISLLSLFTIILAGCGSSYKANGKAWHSPSAIPQETPSQKIISNSSENNSPLPQLLEPTAGSVVITNTTGTHLSSITANYTITLDPAFDRLERNKPEKTLPAD